MTHSFSQFAYLDTNVTSEIAKRPEIWRRLMDYLIDRDLTLAVSSQVAELNAADRLHDSLGVLFTHLPAAIIKQWDVVLLEEVRAHPANRTDSLLLYGLNAMLLEEDGPEKLIRFLSSPELISASATQRRTAQQMLPTYRHLKANFPPKPNGKYAVFQAKEFANYITLQSLGADHTQFLELFRGNALNLDLQVFKSLRLPAMVTFYKYYLGGREPKKLSDFGDQAHLYALPYCVAAVVERDLANVLRQIKRHQPELSATEIYDIDWVKQFC